MGGISPHKNHLLGCSFLESLRFIIIDSIITGTLGTHGFYQIPRMLNFVINDPNNTSNLNWRNK